MFEASGSQGDVVGHRSVKSHCQCDHAHQTAQTFQGEFAHIRIIDLDRSACDIVNEPADGPGWTFRCQIVRPKRPCDLWDIEGHLFEDRSVILVAEVDRIERTACNILDPLGPLSIYVGFGVSGTSKMRCPAARPRCKKELARDNVFAGVII